MFLQACLYINVSIATPAVQVYHIVSVFEISLQKKEIFLKIKGQLRFHLFLD